jgi:hypothetical protein
MSDTEIFSETTSSIAGAADCEPGLVRNYCDWGLIECRRLKSGMRLLKPSAAEKVRKLRTQRLARRGGNYRTKAAIT